MTRRASSRLVAARRRRRKTGVALPMLCMVHGIPKPVPEYHFAIAVGRQFRFDWAWPAQLLALEVEGGVLRGGGHQHPEGFLRDIEKYNLAVLMGWRVLRCLPVDVADGSVVNLLQRAFGAMSLTPHEKAR